MLKKALILVLLLTFTSAADPFGNLKLSEETHQKVNNIHRRYNAQRAGLETSLKSKKFELMRLLQHPQATAPKVKNVVSEIMQVEHQRQNLYIEELFECRQHLSEQEWAEYRRSIIRLMMTKK